MILEISEVTVVSGRQLFRSLVQSLGREQMRLRDEAARSRKAL